MINSAEAATEGVLLENLFLKISKNSQENTGARVYFLIKLQASGLWTTPSNSATIAWKSVSKHILMKQTELRTFTSTRS